MQIKTIDERLREQATENVQQILRDFHSKRESLYRDTLIALDIPWSVDRLKILRNLSILQHGGQNSLSVADSELAMTMQRQSIDRHHSVAAAEFIDTVKRLETELAAT